MNSYTPKPKRSIREPRVLTEEEVLKVNNMIEDGTPLREVERTLNVGAGYLRTRGFKSKFDRADAWQKVFFEKKE